MNIRKAEKIMFQKVRLYQSCDHLITHTDFENELSQKFYLNAGMIPAMIEFWKEL